MLQIGIFVIGLALFFGFVTREERDQRDRDEGPRSMIR